MIRIILVGLALLTLGACETAKGAGQDIQKAGNAISNTAQDVQNAL
ncbi:entericidin A/B family lipoprotein [Rhodobacteraceae bacterium F11138]|nr:entericidin A/B family lipoprotein [Rhodobacteraceae bacterium F11138]